jgi:hypothetical protein
MQARWLEPSRGAITSSRTRNGGSGRPNLCIKRIYNAESTTDSDYEADEDSSSEDEVEFDNSTGEEEEEEEAEDDDETSTKPSPTRLFIEYESLKKCMEKNCRCLKCNGPVRMTVKTLPRCSLH